MMKSSRRQFAGAVLGGLAHKALADEGASGGNRLPVLVELFTSEGCSSCPPADLLLEKLDQKQPLPVVVLSEHVDYWNSSSWSDPYSSPLFSSRQQSYARRFGLQSTYMPQMIVDGAAEFVGSDWRRAEPAIASAAKQEKVNVRITKTATGVRIEVDPLSSRRTADVYFAIAADSGTSDVAGGENRGRRLHHVAIVRRLDKVGSVNSREGFAKDLPVTASGAMRLVAFVQESGAGRVWGTAIVKQS